MNVYLFWEISCPRLRLFSHGHYPRFPHFPRRYPALLLSSCSSLFSPWLPLPSRLLLCPLLEFREKFLQCALPLSTHLFLVKDCKWTMLDFILFRDFVKILSTNISMT
jgi:hypothetical protein